MRQWSRGYELLRYYVRFAFWLTHRRIVVTGREQIPKGKAIIFAANHQNALMDPLALVCTNPLQTLWLARADIFKNKTARPVLKFLKMVPIYRIRDGKENLSNNEQVFNQVAQVLESAQTVALFPEAAHSGKRQMLPHKKAIPRIALEAEDKNNFSLGLQILPVGIYYDHYWKFNRTLLVQYGSPIEIDRYKELYTENQQNAMLVLRNEIHERLSPLTMQINSEKYYVDYENIRLLAGEEFAKKVNLNKDSVIRRFKADQLFVAKIEQLEVEQPSIFEQIIKQTGNYFSEIGKAGIMDGQLNQAIKASFPKLLVQFIGALLSLPVFIFGFLFNAIPFYIPRLFLTRKVKDPAFLSTFNFAAGLILFPLFYLIEACLVFLFSGSLMMALMVFALEPFAGKYAYQLSNFYSNLYQSIKLNLINKTLLKRLSKYRKETISAIFTGSEKVVSP